jgi:hypothetical protein
MARELLLDLDQCGGSPGKKAERRCPMRCLTLLALLVFVAAPAASGQMWSGRPNVAGDGYVYGPDGQVWATMPNALGGFNSYRPHGQVWTSCPNAFAGLPAYGPGGETWVTWQASAGCSSDGPGRYLPTPKYPFPVSSQAQCVEDTPRYYLRAAYPVPVPAR